MSNRTKGLALNWVLHLEGKEKEEFAKYVIGSTAIIERLATIIDKKITESSKTPKTDYDTPSWAYKQADANGYLRALKELQTLTQHIRK